MQSEKIAELLHQYFELGVAEGREGRNHDTEAGDAQRVLSEIEAEIAAFSAAEPIGFLIPRGDVAGPDNEYYSFCEDQGSAAAEADIYDKGYFPIYAAPPARTAQVQDVAGIVEMVENCVMFSAPGEYYGLADHAAFEAGQDNAIRTVVKLLRDNLVAAPAKQEGKP